MPEQDYLEVDKPIPGQNFVCLSFVSPEKTLKQRELFLFNKFMNQRCGEWELKIDEIIKDASDELKNKIGTELKEVLVKEMKYTYSEFDSKFEDFKYKYNDDLNKAFSRIAGQQTSVRGVKVRGVYDSVQEAERKAKELQRLDSSFHVFVGQVGYWLPWDPQADHVEDEEYLEEELNNLMKEYKKNEVSRDIFYEEQKREKLKDSITKEMAEESRQSEQDALEADDPWMKSKFENSVESTSEPTTEAQVQEVENTTDSNNETSTEQNVESTESDVNTNTSSEDNVKEI